ncbi:MAG: nitrilase-related carbon-nitrogen hydrolase [Candidatus Celaenobacter antarcticus]|nr:nitrilase-related carbon-nitrogen hydrolase [Candidatus Celaenobacter antarcticus]
MRVGFLQFSPELFHEKQNLEKISKMLNNCSTDLVVLPELCTSGYSFNSKNEMEPLSSTADGRIPDFFKHIAEREDTALVAGFLEKDGNQFYNSQIFIDPSGTQTIYRKIHLFLNEKDLFEAGNSGFKIAKYDDASLGLMVCFDWIFPESARTLSVMGADILCHSANLVLPFCQKAMITRSIENHVYTITSNRVGTERRGDQALTFTGMSQITDPQGNILAQANEVEEVLIAVDIDHTTAKNKMITEKNHLFEDRRKEFYEV